MLEILQQLKSVIFHFWIKDQIKKPTRKPRPRKPFTAIIKALKKDLESGKCKRKHHQLSSIAIHP